MGAGIAQTVALGGYSVRLYDVAPERLPLAQGQIAASLSRQVGRGSTQQASADEASVGFCSGRRVTGQNVCNES